MEKPDIVIKCLEAGKHVLSEKPIGKDVATAKKLVEGYEKRFAPKGLIWRVAESKSSPVGREYGTNTDSQTGYLNPFSLSRGML
jgi:hypothetical protein